MDDIDSTEYIGFMEYIFNFAKKYRRVIIWSCLIVAIYISTLLRISTIDHQLFWDEAENLLQMQELSKSWSVNSVQLWHPPLYIFVGALLQELLGFREYQMIILSNILGLLTIVLVFLLTKRLSGDRIAVVTAFAMALSPHLNYFGSWVKQDMMMTFLVVAAMLAFVYSRWIMAGVFFALALLTKEPAIVFMIIMVVFSIYTKSIDSKKLGAMILIGLGLSIWWYLSFGDYMPTLIHMVTGGSQESQMWSDPFYEFLGRIPADMTWTTTVLLITGIGAMFIRRNKNDILPTLWFALPYMILMFMAGKSNWFALPFVPAIAWISALGADRLYESLKRLSHIVAICFLILIPMFWAFETKAIGGYDRYIDDSNVSTQHSQVIYQVAESMESYSAHDGTIAMPYENPLLLWLTDIPRERAVDLPKDPSQIRQFILTNKISEIVLWRGESYISEIDKILLLMAQNNELPRPFRDKYVSIYGI